MLDVETIDERRPVLLVVVGSTSTARVVQYLTADAVYTAAGSDDSASNGEGHNKESLFFKYLVAADDESVDLRRVKSTSALTLESRTT